MDDIRCANVMLDDQYYRGSWDINNHRGDGVCLCSTKAFSQRWERPEDECAQGLRQVRGSPLAIPLLAGDTPSLRPGLEPGMSPESACTL